MSRTRTVTVLGAVLLVGGCVGWATGLGAPLRDPLAGTETAQQAAARVDALLLPALAAGQAAGVTWDGRGDRGDYGPCNLPRRWGVELSGVTTDQGLQRAGTSHSAEQVPGQTADEVLDRAERAWPSDQGWQVRRLGPGQAEDPRDVVLVGQHPAGGSVVLRHRRGPDLLQLSSSAPCRVDPGRS